MATRLSWLGKVVRNSAALIVVVGAVAQTEAQSLHEKKITYSCSSTDFGTVIEDLSKVTGVHFVYSSNKVQAMQQITLSVKDQPLSEVLDVLSRQMNLSFKIQEHYVTVKPRGMRYQARATEMVSTTEPTQGKRPDQDSENAERPLGKFVAEKISNAITLPSNDGNIAAYVAKLKPYFDSAFLRKVPIQYLKSTTGKLRVDRGWFISAGSLVNEYSAGMEIQAGFHHAYVVYSPTWLRDDQYHGGLGVGTSLQLSNVFSLRPVYSYASLKQSKMERGTVVFAKTPGYQINTRTEHHQFKLMMQYDISKNFKFRAGPTFNQSNTTTDYQLPETVSYRTTGPQYYPSDIGNDIHVAFHGTAAPIPPTVASHKFWVGWEASLSYRINFK